MKNINYFEARNVAADAVEEVLGSTEILKNMLKDSRDLRYLEILLTRAVERGYQRATGELQ